MDRKTHTHILNIWGAYGGSSRTCMKLGTLFLDSEICFMGQLYSLKPVGLHMDSG